MDKQQCAQGAMGSAYILSVLILVTGTTLASGARLSACFNSKEKEINIVCSPGSMVRVLKAFYGYSEQGACEYHEGDCTLPEFENYNCVGQDRCSINLPTGTYGSLIQACGYSNYFQVEYECVPASRTHDICRMPHITGQSGYLSTPRYPKNYPKDRSCNTTIEVDPRQVIRLHIIDMDLEARGKTDCADSFYFNDRFHSITLCGRRANESYKTFSNVLDIELSAGSGGRSKGFWLYYEAFPVLPATHPPVVTNSNKAKNEHRFSTTKRPVTKATNWPETDHRDQNRAPPTSTPIPVFRDVVTPSNAKSSLPFAAIAGGVIGTLSVILIILLTLLVIKWFKERRYYQDKDQFLDHRNPAFRSSGDFNTCTMDVDYYHC